MSKTRKETDESTMAAPRTIRKAKKRCRTASKKVTREIQRVRCKEGFMSGVAAAGDELAEKVFK